MLCKLINFSQIVFKLWLRHGLVRSSFFILRIFVHTLKYLEIFFPLKFFSLSFLTCSTTNAFSTFTHTHLKWFQLSVCNIFFYEKNLKKLCWRSIFFKKKIDSMASRNGWSWWWTGWWRVWIVDDWNCKMTAKWKNDYFIDEEAKKIGEDQNLEPEIISGLWDFESVT